MDQATRPTQSNTGGYPTILRQILRSTIHFLSYHFIYERQRTRTTKAAGFTLTVPPTVFHPRWFLTSEYFAGFIGALDLAGKTVVDVGTGSGILALAAARAGSKNVVAVDINPNAAKAASLNASANGLRDRVDAVCSNLISALAPKPTFDVIISSPPSFAGEPRDIADRAWHAGPGYRDIVALFAQAGERMAPGGTMYLLLSSDSDLALMDRLARDSGFTSRPVNETSIFVEKFIIYEVRRATRNKSLCKARC